MEQSEAAAAAVAGRLQEARRAQQQVEKEAALKIAKAEAAAALAQAEAAEHHAQRERAQVRGDLGEI